MSEPKNLTSIPEALVFDVFGTVFDWRTTVTTHLEQVISQKLQSLDAVGATLAATVKDSDSSNNNNNKPALPAREELHSFCSKLAREWRDSYIDFVSSQGGEQKKKKNNDTSNDDKTDVNAPNTALASAPTPYVTIDSHHLTSLRSLLQKHDLTADRFTPAEVHSISQIWHSLKPWEDSKPGVEALRRLSIVSTLSNGNVRLLVDLEKNSGVVFDAVLSSQLWKGYKPDGRVYIGACEVLGVGGEEAWRAFAEESGDDGDGVEGQDEEGWRRGERRKVAMVAAHISDLRAAKKCGLTTIYIERPGEDDGKEEATDYRKNGEDWIDMWVTHAEGGILEVARRLKELK
ncbi:hypothetical protein ABW20_dc0102539 [Dactylellina cionopaga]|nr:hypothetical protein ABW20_dc0102539 [Dactylellina cionopaga]